MVQSETSGEGMERATLVASWRAHTGCVLGLTWVGDPGVGGDGDGSADVCGQASTLDGAWLLLSASPVGQLRLWAVRAADGAVQVLRQFAPIPPQRVSRVAPR